MSNSGALSDIRQAITHPDFPEEYTDFRDFLALTWHHIGLPQPTYIQNDAALFLERGPDPTKSPFEAPNNRIFLAAFRGMGKSYLASALVDYYLAKDPTLNIVVVSGAKDRADDFTGFCQRVLYEVPQLAYLIPHNTDRWSRVSFSVAGAGASHMPSVKSRSIGGMLVGNRADIVIADDVETPQNSDTQNAREKLDRLCTEFENIIKPHARVIYLGTYQTADSYYHRLPAKGYACRIYPARYPDDIARYQGFLAPKIVADLERGERTVRGRTMAVAPGIPTDPERFDELTLQEKEVSMGRTQSELQLMLNPELSDRLRYPLKVGDLIVMDCHTKVAPEQVVYASGPQQVLDDIPNPGFTGDRFFRPMQTLGDWKPYQGKLLTIDPAGSGGDMTAAMVTAVLNGMIYVLYKWGTTERPDEMVLNHLAQIALDYRCNHVRLEDNFGDGMFGQVFRPVLTRVYQTKEGQGCSLDGVKHFQQKEKRILAVIEPPLNAHRIVVDRKMVVDDHENYSESHRLFHQMTRLQDLKGALTHDDFLDCLAMAIQYWNEIQALSLDFRETMEMDREEEEIRALEEFMQDGNPFTVNERENFLAGRRYRFVR
jgi:hypothetical protein